MSSIDVDYSSDKTTVVLKRNSKPFVDDDTANMEDRTNDSQKRNEAQGLELASMTTTPNAQPAPYSLMGLRDAFHPPSPFPQPVWYPPHELEKHLPSEGSRPENFGVVVPGVYRSSFPQTADYAFIQRLGLKTIVTLVRKDFPEGYDDFLRANGIRHCVFDMKGTKKESIPLKTMKSILRTVLDRRNHPLLVHCNHGKHRTGCVIGVVRKLSGWDVSSIISEYKAYAEPKARECDIQYLSAFETAELSNLFQETPSPTSPTAAPLPFWSTPSQPQGQAQLHNDYCYSQSQQQPSVFYSSSYPYSYASPPSSVQHGGGFIRATLFAFMMLLVFWATGLQMSSTSSREPKG